MPPRSLHYAQALGSDSTDKRLDILRRIHALGSISEAARQAGLSYKGAWQAIDTLSNLAGLPLLERSIGGAGGGGAQLTAAGAALLAAADQLAAAKAGVLAQLERGPAAARLPAAHLGALGLRTSMRNQLPCQVLAVRARGAARLVELALADGSPLHSHITAQSAELLQLQAGKPVLALFKATAVSVAPAGDSAGTGKKAAARPQDGRNVLAGTVQRASRAAGGGEVALQLQGGLQVVGFCGPASGLRVRQPARATLDAAAVVIALA